MDWEGGADGARELQPAPEQAPELELRLSRSARAVIRMKRRSLKASVKPTLQKILEDYPGGQLLSEALQNAEDSGSTNFALMLDLRQHDSGAVDERLVGPAFVLVDDGSGLGEVELSSLCNLHDSANATRPPTSGGTAWAAAASSTTRT